MRSLPNSTNGVVVLSDSFTTSIFKQSFLRIFNKDDQGHLSMGFNATFDVQVSFSSFNHAYIWVSMHHERRLQKNWRYPVLLGTLFLLERNQAALERLKSVSVKHQRGRLMWSLHIPRRVFISKLWPQLANHYNKALVVSSNSSHIINIHLDSNDCG